MDAIKAAAAAADNGAQPGAAPTFLTALAQAAEGAQRNAVSANVAVPDVATIKLQAKTAKRRAQAVKRDPKTGLEIKNEWQRDTDIMYAITAARRYLLCCGHALTRSLLATICGCAACVCMCVCVCQVLLIIWQCCENQGRIRYQERGIPGGGLDAGRVRVCDDKVPGRIRRQPSRLCSPSRRLVPPSRCE